MVDSEAPGRDTAAGRGGTDEPAADTSTEPTARLPEATARRLGQSLRDMVWSLVALLLIIGVLLVFNRGCAFSPGGPTIDPSSAPTTDVIAVLPGAAKTVDFAVRAPAVPQGWVGNSSSTGAVPPASVVVRSGWLTPQRFVQLSQSGAAGPDLVRAETEQADPSPTGRVDVSGTQWTVYPGRRSEVVWLADLGDARVLISGTGTEAEFRALADAVTAGRPLPNR